MGAWKQLSYIVVWGHSNLRTNREKLNPVLQVIEQVRIGTTIPTRKGWNVFRVIIP